jgi:hypothetical protein
MNLSVENANEISPDLIRRTRGGWLAVAPSGALLSVGVTAPTEELAREKFRSVFKRWVEILETEPK